MEVQLMLFLSFSLLSLYVSHSLALSLSLSKVNQSIRCQLDTKYRKPVGSF